MHLTAANLREMVTALLPFRAEKGEAPRAKQPLSPLRLPLCLSAQSAIRFIRVIRGSEKFGEKACHSFAHPINPWGETKQKSVDAFLAFSLESTAETLILIHITTTHEKEILFTIRLL
jgi:hypothetical protein